MPSNLSQEQAHAIAALLLSLPASEPHNEKTPQPIVIGCDAMDDPGDETKDE